LAYIVPLDIPKCCAECPFRTSYEEIVVEKGLYQKISRCFFQTEIDDPYRSNIWMMANKEKWCPLKEEINNG
jgi:hypothetical protein